MRSESQNIILKLVPRILLIGVFLYISNTLYTQYLWEEDLDEEAPMMLDLLRMEDTARIVYLGESSNFSYNPTKDSLTDRISDFISYYFPDIPFGTLNHSAYHAGIYKPVIKAIPEGSSIETVIVTLNMRTLDDAAIHSDLETALQKMAVMHEPRPPLLNRALMTLNFYDNTPYVERDREMWEAWTYDTLRFEEMEFPHPTVKSWCEVVKFPNEDGTEDMAKRALADHYIKAYAFEIKEDNPRIKDLDDIVELCKERDLNLVFNLLAENVQYADSLVGENLVWLMKRNRDYLVDRYNKNGVIVVDNLDDVPGANYTDQNWTTEHYGETGRQIIARNVADSLRTLYPEFYVKREIVSYGN